MEKDIDFELVGNHIRKFRIMNNLTQQELADEINISVGHLSNIERGTKKPGLEVIYKISRAVSCSIDEIIKDDNIAIMTKFKTLLDSCSDDELNIIMETCITLIKTMKNYNI